MERTLLDMIDSVDQSTIYAEMEVCSSVAQSYAKVLTMLEYDSDISSYSDIFMEADSGNKVVTKLNIIQRIVRFIKELWQKIIIALSKFKIKRMVNRLIQDIKNSGKTEIKFYMSEENCDFAIDFVEEVREAGVGPMTVNFDFLNYKNEEERVKAIATLMDTYIEPFKAIAATLGVKVDKNKSANTAGTLDELLQAIDDVVVPFDPNELIPVNKCIAVLELIVNAQTKIDFDMKTFSKMINNLNITENDIAEHIKSTSTEENANVSADSIQAYIKTINNLSILIHKSTIAECKATIRNLQYVYNNNDFK